MSTLPLLFCDHDFPDAYRFLVDGRAEVVGPDDDDLATAVAAIAGAKRRWGADAFAQAPLLRVISRIGIGYDNVDVHAATAAGVTVCNAPEAPSVSTAEHALALMLAITKQLPGQIARAGAGLAAEPASTSLELDGATLGLVGVGRIGSRVARAALAMGMRVLACDPGVGEMAGCQMCTLDHVLANSDVISLHAPAIPATAHLINATSLAATRPGVYLINCARGSLVDQEALLAALDRGHVAGAALDVTDPEPLPVGHPLLTHPRVIVTPHVASSTAAGRIRLYQHAIDNAMAVLDGRPATIVQASG